MPRFRHALIVTVIAAAWVISASPSQGADPTWEHKVVPSVLQHEPAAARDFFIFLTDQADLTGVDQLRNKTEKNVEVYHRLRTAAERSQPAVLRELHALGIDARPYWIVNAILVTADEQVLARMASRPDVAMIYGNPQGAPPEMPEAASTATPDDPRLPAIAANLLLIGAPQVWAAGATGEDVIVAILDTGAVWDHEALINRYRGWDGVTADHNYNWYDVTGANLTEPVDDNGHGTATLGVIVGDDSGAHQVGVAPGARWIACSISDVNQWALEWYLEALQWIAAPTDLAGLNPDPSQAPDVLQNSWYCDASEGCDDPLVLQPAFANLRAAGMFLVVAAGNSGPNCETISDPPAIYDEVFSVGTSLMNDEIWNFSSRGPVTSDGSGRMKPDATAPETQLTTFNVGGYTGPYPQTSWTSPHASGLAALLISARPDLRGDIDQLEDIIRLSAVPLTTTQECGGVPGSMIPNNTFGWGRLDALSAYHLATSSTLVTIEGLQQVLADGAQVTFGDIDLAYHGLASETFDVSLDTNLLADGWGAHLAYDGGEYQSFSMPMNDGDAATFHVVMDVGATGSGSVFVNIATQGSGGEIIRTLEFAAFVGGTDLLIVSDDAGAGLAHATYGPAIDPTGKTYSAWSRTLAPVPPDILTSFDAVIWQSGDESTVLEGDDRAALDGYLATGGNLLLAGDDILESLYNQGGAARFWYQLKMRVGYDVGDSGNHDVVGMPGTVGDGLTFTLTGGDPDQLELLNNQPVEEAFQFGNGAPAGTQTTYNDYKIMYLPFGLEKVPAEADRISIIDGVLAWFDLLTPTNDVPLARTYLAQNAPNPFNPATTIAFVLGRTDAVRLEIFNARGQLIRVLVDENLPAGAHSVVWNGETDGGQHAASGTYFYRLNANDEVLTMKMSLVK